MVKFPSHLNNREHSSQAPRHKSGFQMFTESLLGQAHHKMPYIAQLTVMISLGVLNSSLRLQFWFLPLPNQRKRLHWGWEGSSLGEKKKQISWLYSPWRSSQLSILVPCDLSRGKEILVNEWLLNQIKAQRDYLLKNNILEVWVNKRSFLLPCLVTS